MRNNNHLLVLLLITTSSSCISAFQPLQVGRILPIKCSTFQQHFDKIENSQPTALYAATSSSFGRRRRLQRLPKQGAPSEDTSIIPSLQDQQQRIAVSEDYLNKVKRIDMPAHHKDKVKVDRNVVGGLLDLTELILGRSAMICALLMSSIEITSGISFVDQLSLLHL